MWMVGMWVDLYMYIFLYRQIWKGFIHYLLVFSDNFGQSLDVCGVFPLQIVFAEQMLASERICPFWAEAHMS